MARGHNKFSTIPAVARRFPSLRRPVLRVLLPGPCRACYADRAFVCFACGGHCDCFDGHFFCCCLLPTKPPPFGYVLATAIPTPRGCGHYANDDTMMTMMLMVIPSPSLPGTSFATRNMCRTDHPHARGVRDRVRVLRPQLPEHLQDAPPDDPHAA